MEVAVEAERNQREKTGAFHQRERIVDLRQTNYLVVVVVAVDQRDHLVVAEVEIVQKARFVAAEAGTGAETGQRDHLVEAGSVQRGLQTAGPGSVQTNHQFHLDSVVVVVEAAQTAKESWCSSVPARQRRSLTEAER